MQRNSMKEVEKSICVRCAQPYVDFSQHTRRHPECSPCVSPVVEDVMPPALQAMPWEFASSLEMLMDQVAQDLMAMRYEHGFSEPDIEITKRAAERWIKGACSVAALQLMKTELLAPSTTIENLKTALSVDIFHGLQTKAQELAAAKREVPYLEPRVVYPDGNGKGEPIVSFDQAEIYFRRLNHDTAFRKKIVAKSDELKTGTKYQVQPDSLDDILDGTVARWHPHIHRPATEDEKDDVRIINLEQVDDLELCNTLGVARGKHKQCGVQVACLNLPAEERFKPEEIMLPVLSRASVYKKHGMTRVLAGVDKETGEQHDEPCRARDMQRLDEGVWGTIPDDENGGRRWIRLKNYNLTISADDPAKKSLTPFVESCSAHRHCNCCSYHAKGATAGRPLSFLRAPAEPACKRSRLQDEPPKLHNAGELHALLRSLRGSRNAAAIKKAYDEHGINKLYYALEYYPHVNLLELPFDTLHLFPDGLLRSEGAWLHYVLIKLGLDLRRVDAAVRACSSLPRDVRIPPLHAALKKGTKHGCAKSSAVLRMTGSQVMHFALHR